MAAILDWPRNPITGRKATSFDEVIVHGRCVKCAIAFTSEHPEKIQYANDITHGERLIHVCWRCGYRWSLPTADCQGQVLKVPHTK